MTSTMHTFYVELHAQGSWQIVHEGTDEQAALDAFGQLVREGYRARLEADVKVSR